MKILISEKQLKKIIEITMNEQSSDMFQERTIKLLDLDPESDFNYNGEIYEIGDFGKMLLNIDKNNRIGAEDMRKLEKYGKAFVENKDKIEYDIDKVQSVNDIYDLLGDFIEVEDIEDDLDKDITYFYKDNELIIAQPKTEKAAVLLSKGTGWPIAFGKYATNKDLRKYDNEFEQLNSQGPIYIIIEKGIGKSGEISVTGAEKKYMVHFESDEIIDDQDKSLRLQDLMRKSEKIEEFFVENRPEEVEKILNGI